MLRVRAIGRIFHSGGAPRSRPRAVLLAAAVALSPVQAQLSRPGARTVDALVQVARLEDRRPRDAASLDSLRRFASDPRAVVRAAAVRALGRLQQPTELPAIFERLFDVAAVRAEAVNAVGQALRGAPPPASAMVRSAFDTLLSVARKPGMDPATVGLVARTIGRLPHADAASARGAEGAIVGLMGTGLARAEGVLHGLYGIARARRTLGPPSAEALDVARRALTTRAASDVEGAARVRRLAWLIHTAAGAVEWRDVELMVRDPDEQVRRLVAVSLATVGDTAARVAMLERLVTDRSPIVRHEAVRAWRPLAAAAGCGALIRAVGDPNPHVQLAAIDGLGPTCRERERVADTLLNLIDAHRSDSPARAPGRSGWHVHGHALAALARTDAARALPVVRRDAREVTFWGIRSWVARAAATLRDTATLRALAGPGHGNAREIALGALASVAGHAADDLFLAALDAPEYHVVAEAAQALRGSPAGQPVVDALLRTLARLSDEDRDNTRDARVAILERLSELGDRALAPRLSRYLADRDSAVALRAMGILRSWGTDAVATTTHRGPEADLAPLFAGEWRARFVMSPATGGGVFEVRLHASEAPYTVARFIRLARAGFYNGLTFHRVEPGFVIQGGSPAANGYVGDGPFLRDELGTRSHRRGTLGISTRGRDTGDAQFFVNLTDNFRLDHDYTVFGEIVRGRDVAEGILEADVIDRIEILPQRR